jgi:hypothetical protein
MTRHMHYPLHPAALGRTLKISNFRCFLVAWLRRRSGRRNPSATLSLFFAGSHIQPEISPFGGLRWPNRVRGNTRERGSLASYGGASSVLRTAAPDLPGVPGPASRRRPHRAYGRASINRRLKNYSKGAPAAADAPRISWPDSFMLTSWEPHGLARLRPLRSRR